MMGMSVMLRGHKRIVVRAGRAVALWHWQPTPLQLTRQNQKIIAAIRPCPRMVNDRAMSAMILAPLSEWRAVGKAPRCGGF
jgi:hypothetical protein